MHARMNKCRCYALMPQNRLRHRRMDSLAALRRKNGVILEAIYETPDQWIKVRGWCTSYSNRTNVIATIKDSWRIGVKPMALIATVNL
jgi:hypothetical protein